MDNERGLTLVEVLATVAIVGIVILAFVQLSNHYRLSDRQSESLNAANQILEQMAHEIRAELSASSNLQSLLAAKASAFNATYTGRYQFYIQNEAASSNVTFSNPCAPNNRQASIPFTVYDQNKSRIITITACWGK